MHLLVITVLVGTREVEFDFDYQPFFFCRLDYQARPHVRGQYAVRRLIAKLPPRAHSVYYRDEIGNVSTSNLWSDSKKVIYIRSGLCL